MTAKEQPLERVRGLSEAEAAQALRRDAASRELIVLRVLPRGRAYDR